MQYRYKNSAKDADVSWPHVRKRMVFRYIQFKVPQIAETNPAGKNATNILFFILNCSIEQLICVKITSKLGAIQLDIFASVFCSMFNDNSGSAGGSNKFQNKNMNMSKDAKTSPRSSSGD
jgi:hypothetical protein